MSVNDTGAGADPGGTGTGGGTGGDTGTGTGSDQDQAKAEVRAQPQVDDSQASVGEIPNDPAAVVAQYDTNFDGSAVA